MVMNKQKQVFGVVEKVEENKDYTGVKTATADVSVNNTTREISVDVDFSAMLGDTNKTAYPGHLGAQTRQLLMEDIEALEREKQRALAAEEELEELISDVAWDIELGDSKVKEKVYAEEARATLAEQNLHEELLDFRAETSNNLQTVSDSVEHLKDYVDTADKKLQNIIAANAASCATNLDKLSKDVTKQISTLDKTLSSELSSLSTALDETYAQTQEDIQQLQNKIKQEIQISIEQLEDKDTKIIASVETLQSEVVKADNELRLSVKTIEDNYAEKTYVYEQLATFTKLSKQLVDYVDLSNNTVTIGSESFDAVDGILYLVKDLTATVEDIYKEYTTVEGKLTLIGDTSTSLKGYATEEFVNNKFDSIDLTPYAKTVDLPVKVSQLENDSNYAKKEEIPDVSEFITAIPSEYITEKELADKNYYTLDNITQLLNNIEFIDGGNAPVVII